MSLRKAEDDALAWGLFVFGFWLTVAATAGMMIAKALGAWADAPWTICAIPAVVFVLLCILCAMGSWVWVFFLCACDD